MTVEQRHASEGARTALRRSYWLLWWIPLSTIVGFVVASRLLAESWPLSQVVPLAAVLAAPFSIGAYYGLKAGRLGEIRGWIGFTAHIVFMVLALVMPISESLS